MENTHMDNIFNSIMCKYYQSIFNYCFVQLSNNKQSAEDCTQEVFIILYKKMHSLDNLEEIRPWLYKTAGYVISNYKRVNYKHITENIDDYENVLSYDDIANHNQDLEDSKIMSMLSKEEQEFVKDYYINEVPIKELSHILNISEQSVYKRASRIKIKIFKMLNKRE